MGIGVSVYVGWLRRCNSTWQHWFIESRIMADAFVICIAWQMGQRFHVGFKFVIFCTGLRCFSGILFPSKSWALVNMFYIVRSLAVIANVSVAIGDYNNVLLLVGGWCMCSSNTVGRHHILLYTVWIRAIFSCWAFMFKSSNKMLVSILIWYNLSLYVAR